MTDSTISKLNIYGDTFLKKLCPTLKKYLTIAVNDEVTLRGGTIDKLHRKLTRIYKCSDETRKHCENTALIMIGAYDIINFKRPSMLSKYSRKLQKSLAMLIEFLERYHRHILVVTAPPILKMQNRRYHWKLIRKYNKHIKSLSENPKVKIVDVFPSFVEREAPPTCNSSLYVKVPYCSKRDANVLWNDLGIKKAVLRILEGETNMAILNRQEIRRYQTYEEISLTPNYANVRAPKYSKF